MEKLYVYTFFCAIMSVYVDLYVCHHECICVCAFVSQMHSSAPNLINNKKKKYENQPIIYYFQHSLLTYFANAFFCSTFLYPLIFKHPFEIPKSCGKK